MGSNKYVFEASVTAIAVIGCAIIIAVIIWSAPEPYQRHVREGYNVGIRGHSVECCPYTQSEDCRQKWIEGWMQGADELKAVTAKK